MSDETGELDPLTVLQRILGVLGLASIACAGRPIDGPSEGDDEAGESTRGSSDTDTSSDTDDEGPILDFGKPPEPDFGGLPECSGFDRLWIDVALPDDCSWDERRYYAYDIVCAAAPEGTSCAEVPFDPVCYIEAYECGFAQTGEAILCGPFVSEGACCYVVGGDCPVGRPFHVAGRARIAGLASTAWTDPAPPSLDLLDDQTRAALADFWAREGLSEHASVASFARFTHQLLALGAPARLIGASLRAGLDEVRHAQRCFGLASAYAGAAIGPGPLDVHACLAGEQLDPRAIALSLAREGCIAETVSTLLLIAARDRARDPVVRASLAAIVVDELEHVLLAWAALAWMVEREPTLRSVLAQVFAQADRHVGFGVISELPADPARLREHGHLPVAERRAIAGDALARIVRPAARALLGYSSSAPATHAVEKFASVAAINARTPSSAISARRSGASAPSPPI